MIKKSNYKNLAPLLCRQKVTIEGNLDRLVGEEELKDYLLKLSEVVDMQILQPPFAHPAIKNDTLVGYGGWVHWVTSGCAIYSYDKQFTKSGFYLIDIECYTCKPFLLEKAVEFTKNYFQVIEISYREN